MTRGDRPQIALVVGGGGLGHLTRGAALARALEDAGAGCRILTQSPFGPGLARLLGLELEPLPDREWGRLLPARLAALTPDLTVLDTFPAGLRGELAAPPPGLRLAHLARRLRLTDYLEALSLTPAMAARARRRTLVCEPLDPTHRAWLDEARGEQVELPDRIRLELSPGEQELPEELEEFLSATSPWLVVHSGPPDEVRQLVAYARERMSAAGGGRLGAVIPTPIPGLGVPCFEAYPLTPALPRLAGLVGAGGYNLVAEARAAGLGERFHPLPLTRRFDDQRARVAGLEAEPLPTPGAARRAAEVLLSWAEAP